MSRTGYGDCYDARTWGLYEGARARALAGNRGQALLRDLVAALDALLASCRWSLKEPPRP
jgi:hypothetical protein